MPRNFIRRFLPDPEKLRQHKAMQFFGDRVFSAELWQLNRRSVTSAVSIGLFIAFMPLPGQMLLAAAAAIATRSNLPLSVALVWLTNPLTIPPLFYFAYKLGGWLLQSEASASFQYSLSWFSQGLSAASAFIFGCFVLGVMSATFGNLAVRLMWRVWVQRNWAKRKQRRNKAYRNKSNPDKT